MFVNNNNNNNNIQTFNHKNKRVILITHFKIYRY